MYNDKQLFMLVTSGRLCYASDSDEPVVAGLQGLSLCVGVPRISSSSLIPN